MKSSEHRIHSLAVIGGRLEPDNAAIFEQMKQLCDGRIAVLATASEIPGEVGSEAVDSFKAYGFDTELIPLFWDNRRQSAFDPKIVTSIQAYGAIYFTGGDQKRIFDALVVDGVDTPVMQAIRELHDHGGLVAGSSAGAAVMPAQMILAGTSLEALTIGVVDDPDISGLALGPGFGFFPWGVVDQHFIKRGRIGRLVSALGALDVDHGFGVDENTALFVHGTRAYVRGETGVVVLSTRDAEFGPGGQVTNVSVSYLDDGDEYDLKDHRVIPHPDKKPVRITSSSYRQPAPIKRNAFSSYALHVLMLRLAKADPAHYLRDHADARQNRGQTEVRVEIERSPDFSHVLSAPSDGVNRYTIIDFRLHISRLASSAQTEVPDFAVAHYSDYTPDAHLLLLGNSPLNWSRRYVGTITPYLVGPVGVLAAASARAREVARDYVRWLTDLDIEAQDLDVTARNIERCNEDEQLLEAIDGLGTIMIAGGDQRRLTETLLHDDELTPIMTAILTAHKGGANLIGVGGAAAAFARRMIVEGDSCAALRFGASEDAGYEGMVIEPGFGLFDLGIVDQNFIDRRRLGRLLVACGEERSRFGFGLCEESGLLVVENDPVLRAVGRHGFLVAVVDQSEFSIRDHALTARGIELQLIQPDTGFDTRAGAVLNAEPATIAAEEAVARMVSQLARECNGVMTSEQGDTADAWLHMAFTQGSPARLDIQSRRLRF